MITSIIEVKICGLKIDWEEGGKKPFSIFPDNFSDFRFDYFLNSEHFL